MDLRVAILSQQLSPSGSGARCPQPPCNGSRKLVPCYTGSWWSPGRHSPKRVASPYILQRSRTLHSWSQISLFLVRQVPTQLHQLSLFTLSSLMASSSPLAAHMASTPTMDCMAPSSFLPQASWKNSLLFQSSLI